MTIPPTEGIPQQITANGVRLIDGLGPPRVLNLPGHPGWHLEIRQQDNGPLVVHAWFGPDSGVLGGLRHLSIYNRATTGAPVEINRDGSPILLSPLSGIGWSQYADMEGENPWSTWFSRALYNGTVDAPVTRYTGSSTVNFFCPPGIWALRGPVSNFVHSYFNRYLHIQDIRPRWNLDEYGLPLGWDGGIPAPLTNWFGEWHENALGCNAGDAQHWDFQELYYGYKATGDPAFLLSMIAFWTFSADNFGSWQMRDDQTYSGSIRVPGWLLLGSAQLYDALPQMPIYEPLRARVLELMRWHLANIRERHLLMSPWYYGSNPFRSEQLDYQFPWQVAVLEFGLLNVARLVPALREDAMDYAGVLNEMLCGWVRYDGSVCYAQATHVSCVWTHGPGVAWWLLPPLILYRQMTGGETTRAESVLAPLVQGYFGAGPDSFSTVDLAAPLVGFVDETCSMREETSP